MTKRKTAKKLIIFAIVIGLICFAAAKGKTIIELSREKVELLNEQEELIKQKENLELELENISTEEYIENLARRDLKLIKSDELLYIISDKEEETESDNEKESDK